MKTNCISNFGFTAIKLDKMCNLYESYMLVVVVIIIIIIAINRTPTKVLGLFEYSIEY